MVKRIGGDIFGELFETGKSTAKQIGQMPGKIIKTAGQQIAGSTSNAKLPKKIEGKLSSSKPDTKPDKGIGDLLPKSIDEKKMAQLKHSDTVERERGLTAARLELEKMKIQRYQRLQQEISNEEKKKEEEEKQGMRIYEKGKPGAPQTLEEKAELIRKKREEEEKKRQGPLLPKSAEKTPSLERIVKPKKGTKELGKKIIG